MHRLAQIATIMFLAAFVTTGNAVAGENRDRAMIPQKAENSETPEQPRRHFRVKNAANITPEEAEAIYRKIGPELAAGYAMSDDPSARDYRRWPRYNNAPYLSATHGRRYLSNFANSRANAYGRYEKAGRFPVGAVIAKDSFSVTTDGVVNPGPLFLMEKMPEGFNYVSGDWRYTMIMPDGSVFGTTKGANAEKVEYCISCHLARESQDHLYFIPDTHRAESAKPLK